MRAREGSPPGHLNLLNLTAIALKLNFLKCLGTPFSLSENGLYSHGERGKQKQPANGAYLPLRSLWVDRRSAYPSLRESKENGEPFLALT